MEHALVVPRDALRTDDSGAPTLQVRDGSGVSTRKVTLGPADEVEVVVTNGLREGEVVLR